MRHRASGRTSLQTYSVRRVGRLVHRAGVGEGSISFGALSGGDLRTVLLGPPGGDRSGRTWRA